jgi:hypothetical protein
LGAGQVKRQHTASEQGQYTLFQIFLQACAPLAGWEQRDARSQLCYGYGMTKRFAGKHTTNTFATAKMYGIPTVGIFWPFEAPKQKRRQS